MISELVEAVPKKLYAAAVLVLLVAFITAEGAAMAGKLKLAEVSKSLATLQAAVADDRAERERIAREDALEINRMQAKHASAQQEIVHAAQAQAARDAARDRDLRDDNIRLRDALRAYAAGGGGEAAGDAAACGDLRDRSQRLGGLVEEALELSRESESFIRQRDREVRLLKDALGNDRGLLGEGDPR